jgi:deoxycytidylate deaminase
MQGVNNSMAVYKTDVYEWGQSLTGSIATSLAEHFLREAYYTAATSPDSSNQCGAVLTSPWHGNPNHDSSGLFIAARSCNNFHPSIIKQYGIKKLLENRDLKLTYIHHAERNVIYELIRNNVMSGNNRIEPQHCIMYCPWFACMECAKTIEGVGIKTIIGHQQRMDLTPERWIKSIKRGIDYLIQCGVTVRFFDGPIPDCPNIIVNGKEWNPGTLK